jgi:Protein of unknown function (DUF1778)
VSRAAALMGATMAGFVRAAAKEKALALLERESRVSRSNTVSSHAPRRRRAYAPMTLYLPLGVSG